MRMCFCVRAWIWIEVVKRIINIVLREDGRKRKSRGVVFGEWRYACVSVCVCVWIAGSLSGTNAFCNLFNRLFYYYRSLEDFVKDVRMAVNARRTPTHDKEMLIFLCAGECGGPSFRFPFLPRAEEE